MSYIPTGRQFVPSCRQILSSASTGTRSSPLPHIELLAAAAAAVRTDGRPDGRAARSPHIVHARRKHWGQARSARRSTARGRELGRTSGRRRLDVAEMIGMWWARWHGQRAAGTFGRSSDGLLLPAFKPSCRT